MQSDDYSIDSELMVEFIDESADALSSVSSLLVQLEEEPANMDLIGAIFRPIHTIKGNSAFFGLMKVKTLSHEMETILDMLRKKTLTPSQSITSVLLDGVDCLSDMMTRARLGESEVDNEDEFNKLVDRVISSKDSDNNDAVINSAIERLEGFRAKLEQAEPEVIVEFDDIIASIRTLVSAPAKNMLNEKTGVEPLDKLSFIVAKGLSGKTVELDEVEEASCALRELKENADTPETVKSIESALDEFETFTKTIGFDPLLCELLNGKIGEWKKSAKWKNQEEQKPPEQAPTEKKAKQKVVEHPKEQETHKTMRIPEDSIDTFLSYVGELVEIGEMFGHLQRRMANDRINRLVANDFRRANDSLAELSTNLQKSIMDIRKVSMGNVLQKVPRMVRDVASVSGKEIAVKISGSDIVVDKSLIDTLEAPLTHIVRNAADHGIESPSEREMQGKSREGNIKLTVSEEPSDIVIDIHDDGKGIDYDAIKAKAASLGLLAGKASLDSKDIADLIFYSGVSTAKEITDVSGRGVGMDVAKSNVDAAGGKITVESIKGKGSKFSIRLPKSVTTQIIDGFLVEVDGFCYVMPLKRIQESFRPKPDELKTVESKGEYVVRHDSVIVFVRLQEMFSDSPSGMSRSNVDSEEGIMVIVNSGKAKLGVFVDKIIGVQQIVVKQLEGLKLDNSLFLGGSVMGDGKVAMVLDVDGLHNMFCSEMN